MADMHGGRVEDDASSAERIVRGAIRAFRLHPFHEVDAGTVTETCGVDRTVVDRLFPTWDGLLLVAYDRWLPAPRLPTLVRAAVHDRPRADDPGRGRRRPRPRPVLAGVLPLAASERDFAGFFRKRFEEYVEELTVGLQRDIATGVETIGIPAHQAATQLLAVHEGLQVQMLVRPYLDVLVEYDRAVHTLRYGWRQPEPVAWDLDAALVRG